MKIYFYIVFLFLFFPISFFSQETEECGYVLFPKCKQLNGEELKSCNLHELNKFISYNMRYPQAAMDQNHEGVVHVKYIITADSKLKVSIIKQSHEYPELDSAALEVMRILYDSINTGKIKIIPGKKEGKLVNSYFRLPINFKLDKDNYSEPDADKSQMVIATYRTLEKTIQFRKDIDGNIYAYSLSAGKEELLIKINGNTDPELLNAQEQSYFFLYNLTFLKPEILLTLGKIDGKQYEIYIDKSTDRTNDSSSSQTSKMYINIYLSDHLNTPVDVFNTIDQLFNSKYAPLLFK